MYISVYGINLQDDYIIDAAVEKINGCLETYFGIHDAELGLYTNRKGGKGLFNLHTL